MIAAFVPSESRAAEEPDAKEAARSIGRPNVLWITAEDLSPVLGCYGDPDAITPNIDALATHSIRYDNAFAVSPVCSASRTCLISGVMGPTLGTHQMRCNLPFPERVRGFPSLLREAGYFTSNNSKTDYNTGSEPEIIKTSWDACGNEAHWRGRKPGQPFFAVFNLMHSHQSRSMVWPRTQFEQEIQSQLNAHEIHDPATIRLPPYYPDTPIVRRTQARFYDCATVMDKQVGKILGQLKDDGLAEDTIIFFYGDHGSGMPRHKRVLLDSGMKVPLLVHFPKRFKNLCPESTQITDRLVSFVDFPPTVLRLLGVEVPSYMQGLAFAGPHASANVGDNKKSNLREREFVYGHRDRVDEVADMARSVRGKRFLYIRNYMPHLSYNQPSAWPDQGQINHEFFRLSSLSKSQFAKLPAAQKHFVSPTRPIEELYDCQRDPLNLSNLASDPSFAKDLARMRALHHAWVIESKDLGFVHELELTRLTGGKSPYEWARSTGYDPASHSKDASVVGSPNQAAILGQLSSSDASSRFWGTIAAASLSSPTPALEEAVERNLAHSSPAVQIESAVLLAKIGKREGVRKIEQLLSHEDLMVVMYATRAAERLHDFDEQVAAQMQRLHERFKDALTNPAGMFDPAVSIMLSTSAYRKRHANAR